MQKVQCGACQAVFSVEQGIDEEIGCPNCERRLRITGKAVDGALLLAANANHYQNPGQPPNQPDAPLPEPTSPDMNPEQSAESSAKEEIGRELANVAPPAGGELQPSPQAWLVQDKKGREFGPISREELEDLARARTINCECRVRRQTSPVWLWAVEVFPQLADEPDPDDLPEDYPEEYPESGIEEEYHEHPEHGDELDEHGEYVDETHEHHHHKHHRRHRSKMLSHRGSSILLLGLMGFLCGMFGIAAAVMGAQDIRTMRRGDMDPLGYDLTMWGAIIGVLGTLAQCGLVAYLWVTAGN